MSSESLHSDLLALLATLLGIEGVRSAYAEAVRAGYLWHEFGDSHLVLLGGPVP
jgi:S-adenosylmethionine:tRNA ribosyltransferase-isomerase